MIGDLTLRRSIREPVRGPEPAGGQLVAHEQVVGDPLHLPGIEQHRAPPPGLEVQVPRRFGVDLRVDVVGLLPVGVRRVERLEVGDQVGAVEDAVAQVPGERGEPGAAEEAAQVAHRVLAPDPGPVGQRRAGKQDRPGQLGPDRRHHHDLPAGLAVGDDHRLAVGFGCRAATSSRNAASVRQTSSTVWPGHRLGQEADEVAGVAGVERDADLAVVLHPADARAVAGPGIDNHERAAWSGRSSFPRAG